MRFERSEGMRCEQSPVMGCEQNEATGVEAMPTCRELRVNEGMIVEAMMIVELSFEATAAVAA